MPPSIANTRGSAHETDRLFPPTGASLDSSSSATHVFDVSEAGGYQARVEILEKLYHDSEVRQNRHPRDEGHTRAG